VSEAAKKVSESHQPRWNEIIDRRSHEIAEGKVHCRSVEQVVRDIRRKLAARRQQP
jgi:hypothetical protein